MKRTSPLIAPSILSADFARLGEDIAVVERAGADWLHIDVMDGHFVPNITIGPAVVAAVRKRSRLFFDVHLMIARPDRYWEVFRDAGADLITFHRESLSEGDAEALIGRIRESGIRAGVSVKPGTPVEAVMPLLPRLDLVLVMTVEPGFGGQRFMGDMLPKVRVLRERIDRDGLACRIQVDGGINGETAVQAAGAGADVFVAGNSVFGDPDPARAIERLREALDASGPDAGAGR